MPITIGEIVAIYRYPVKSMRGEPLTDGALGWHGVEGDRRLAFRRVDHPGGFPWLSASRLPELVLFTPQRRDGGDGEALPTHVLTPDGEEMPVFGEALASEVGRRCGSSVQMTHLRNGTFDDASISIITSDTVRELCRLAGRADDVRRFRPNIVVRSERGAPFEEEEWVGAMLTFGDDAQPPAVAVTMPDLRCAIVNIDPDDAGRAPEVLKAVASANQSNAGVYGTVTRAGRLAVGQTVMLQR